MISYMFMLFFIVAVLCAVISASLLLEDCYKTGLFLLVLSICIVVHMGFQIQSKRILPIDKVIEHRIMLVDNQALAPGLDENFNTYFQCNITDGSYRI